MVRGREVRIRAAVVALVSALGLAVGTGAWGAPAHEDAASPDVAVTGAPSPAGSDVPAPPTPDPRTPAPSDLPSQTVREPSTAPEPTAAPQPGSPGAPDDAEVSTPAAEPPVVPGPPADAAPTDAPPSGAASLPELLGSIDGVGVDGATVTVSGWAAAVSGGSSPLEVVVEPDGSGWTRARTGLPRPDVAVAYPALGPSTGFVAQVQLARGQHRVCVLLRFELDRRSTPLGCVYVTVLTTPATGNLEHVTARVGGAAVQGWALHPSEPDPVAVHLYVDGAWGGSLDATVARPDVGAAYRAAGPLHGFVAVLRAAPGEHTVCAYAVSVYGDGANPLLGCGSVVVPAHDPVGHLETVAGDGDRVHVAGWVFDPDTGAPLDVHVYRDGAWAGRTWASLDRPDVAAAYGLGEAAHGFSLDLALPTGRSTYCVYAVNQGAGSTNPALGCSTLGLPLGEPFGNLEAVWTGHKMGLVLVEGWAIDPDTRAPVTVHLYVDGSFRGSTQADVVRPDVTAAYPTAGPAHGFVRHDQLIGVHEVCAYAIDVGVGETNPLLGCRLFYG